MAIKKLQNNFTTPEQSKRLMEIGVPADSADCYYLYEDQALPELIEYRKTFTSFNKQFYDERLIPCWSVGRLIEIFLLCTPYKDIALNKSNLVEQMVVSLFMVNKDGLLDFSKLEE